MWPPPTFITWPVIQSACLEQKKRIALAMSSGWPHIPTSTKASPIPIAPASTRRPWAPAYGSLASRTEALARAERHGSRTNQGPIGGGNRTPTQPDTSRNRPAGAPLRPPVIDGIEEYDPTGRIEELDFLESGPHDREPPGFEPDTSRSPPPRRPNTPCHPCARLTNIDVSC